VLSSGERAGKSFRNAVASNGMCAPGGNFPILRNVPKQKVAIYAS
jgi:hypothetical protein